MDLSQATAHFGLSARATATRHGVDWRPRIGPAADRVLFPDADLAFDFTAEFSDLMSNLSLDPAEGFSVVAGGAIEEITVSGVTGTGAASINGTYTRDVVLTNGAPAWTNGSASIRYFVGFWVLYLSGVAQFISKQKRVVPPTSAFWEIAGGGAATGSPIFSYATTGAAPSLLLGRSQLDFEGIFPGTGSICGFLLICTSGAVACEWNTGFVVISEGQHIQLALPGGEAAPAVSNGGLIVYNYTAAASATLSLLATASA
jgi:hypothetical protein